MAQCKNPDCKGGVVYQDDGRCRTCPRCKGERFLIHIGGVGKTWADWLNVPSLHGNISFLQRWSGNPWSVLLHVPTGMSNYGAGKTHASMAVGFEWIISSKRATYFHVADLVNAYRRAINNPLEEPRNVAESPGLLILDDLGTETDSAFAKEKLDAIIGTRYQFKRPTLITTNLDISAMKGRYPRITSRLHEGILLAWHAPDWRVGIRQGEAA